MKKTTNKDIAKLAGVSPSAVSIAMNGRSGISDETRKKILHIAKEHNYVTGAASLKIISTRPKYIAMLFRTDAILDDQIFYSEMAIHAMTACRETGYSVITTFISGETGKIELPAALKNRDVDGVLICGDQEPGLYSELKKLGIPFVILDSSICPNENPAIHIDYEKAAYIATEYLIKLGHSDIAYMSNGSLYDFNIRALSGFQNAMSKYELFLNPNRIQIELGSEAGMKECLNRILSDRKKPTAIFCTVDVYAINIIRYLHTLGIDVPEDMSIVSIDDILMSQYLIPSLSSMHVDKRLMVSKGISMLSKLIEGKNVKNETIPCPKLMKRESTRRIK